MGKILYLNPDTPRIRILEISYKDVGPEIPEWFLEELLDLILPVDTFVQSHRGFCGTARYEFRVGKEKVYNALLRKSKRAAGFLRDSPIFKEPFLCFTEKSCEFLGSWEELECKVETG